MVSPSASGTVAGRRAADSPPTGGLGGLPDHNLAKGEDNLIANFGSFIVKSALK